MSNLKLTIVKPKKTKPNPKQQVAEVFAELERKKRLAKLDALILRVKLTPNKVEKPTRYAPIPKGEYKGPPTYRSWMQFVEGRIGILPPTETGNVQILCLACGLPVDVAATYKIVIGSVVKFEKEEDVVISLDPNIADNDPVKQTIYLPVTKSGQGCIDCQMEYLRICRETPENRTPFIVIEPRDVTPNMEVGAYWEHEQEQGQ